ncbi:MAG: hypothetical protein WC716_16450 [Chitinophagaceae bacterium]|jgi:hypothetical protein
MNSSLPKTPQISPDNIRRMENEIIKAMLRYTPTYPLTTASAGQLGDYSINADGTIMAIHNGTQWKYLYFGDQSLLTTDSPSFTNVQALSTGAFYLGNSTTDGTWRIIRNGANLEMQLRVSGAYVTKQIISA